ncbi:MAG TPA: hypothetical protein VMU45_05860 [Candidatus Eisenbacteria bacterium]|nr:hypothetical protein [Candidatus Eisenbacteria bacterium]
MTNLDNLPIWAKILLGIRACDSAEHVQRAAEESPNDCRTAAVPRVEEAIEQSVVVFGSAPHQGVWQWKASLRPATAGYRS